MSFFLAPSILSADFGNLQRDIEMLNRSQADWIHVDVMDGRFVPNISFGFPVMKTLKQHTTKPLDVHLMIVEPEKYIDQFCEAGADILTVHYEACTHLHRTIHAIKDRGVKAGVSLNPHTPVSVLQHVIEDLDLVLVMSVNPGFAAQKFIQQAHVKIRELRQMMLEQNTRFYIEVDGGVNLHNAPILLQQGADVLVAGNAVFGTKDLLDTISQFKRIRPGEANV